MAVFWSGLLYDPGQDRTPEGFEPLAHRVVNRFDPAGIDASPGRRLRAFATMVCRGESGIAVAPAAHCAQLPVWPDRDVTYAALLGIVERDPDLGSLRGMLSELPLRIGAYGPLITSLPEEPQRSNRDPDLHPALQDLGDEINEDIREALESIDDQHAWYPGIDEGIDPVTDDHVRLVIWALQRELDRELRTGSGSMSSLSPLPAAPLAALPWDVQRALAERRRWRYRQWGIGRDQWEKGVWNLWEVPADPDYLPRRSARLTAA